MTGNVRPETPSRYDFVRDALGGALQDPRDHGLDPILAVHGADYVDFLQTAFAEWLAQGREGDAIGYAFPVRGRRPLAMVRQIFLISIDPNQVFEAARDPGLLVRLQLGNIHNQIRFQNISGN